MPIPLFVNDQIVTAAQLNAMVDKLNQAELVSHIPQPHFQRRYVEGNNAVQTWYFSFLHQPQNTKLYYRYNWGGSIGGGPNLYFDVYRPTVGAEVAPVFTRFTPPMVAGLTGGFLDITPTGLQGATLPGGALYVLKVYVSLKSTPNYSIDWLYEST